MQPVVLKGEFSTSVFNCSPCACFFFLFSIFSEIKQTCPDPTKFILIFFLLKDTLPLKLAELTVVVFCTVLQVSLPDSDATYAV